MAEQNPFEIDIDRDYSDLCIGEEHTVCLNSDQLFKVISFGCPIICGNKLVYNIQQLLDEVLTKQ